MGDGRVVYGRAGGAPCPGPYGTQQGGAWRATPRATRGARGPAGGGGAGGVCGRRRAGGSFPAGAGKEDGLPTDCMKTVGVQLDHTAFPMTIIGGGTFRLGALPVTTGQDGDDGGGVQAGR